MQCSRGLVFLAVCIAATLHGLWGFMETPSPSILAGSAEVKTVSEWEQQGAAMANADALSVEETSPSLAAAPDQREERSARSFPEAPAVAECLRKALASPAGEQKAAGGNADALRFFLIGRCLGQSGRRTTVVHFGLGLGFTAERLLEGVAAAGSASAADEEGGAPQVTLLACDTFKTDKWNVNDATALAAEARAWKRSGSSRPNVFDEKGVMRADFAKPVKASLARMAEGLPSARANIGELQQGLNGYMRAQMLKGMLPPSSCNIDVLTTRLALSAQELVLQVRTAAPCLQPGALVVVERFFELSNNAWEVAFAILQHKLGLLELLSFSPPSIGVTGTAYFRVVAPISNPSGLVFERPPDNAEESRADGTSEAFLLAAPGEVFLPFSVRKFLAESQSRIEASFRQDIGRVCVEQYNSKMGTATIDNRFCAHHGKDFVDFLSKWFNQLNKRETSLFNRNLALGYTRGFSALQKQKNLVFKELLKREAESWPCAMVHLDKMLEVWDFIVSPQMPAEGAVVEVGVWKGGTSTFMAHALRFQHVAAAAANLTRGSYRDMWLFDTFEGLPEPDKRQSSNAYVVRKNGKIATKDETKTRSANDIWDEALQAGNDVTKSFQSGSPYYDPKTGKLRFNYGPIDVVQDNIFGSGFAESKIRFIKGKVEDTMVESSTGAASPGKEGLRYVPNESNLPKDIAILRLDTDWYESTKVELQVLVPRLVPGGLLQIDDYCSWQGARDATDEWLREILDDGSTNADRFAEIKKDDPKVCFSAVVKA